MWICTCMTGTIKKLYRMTVILKLYGGDRACPPGPPLYFVGVPYYLFGRYRFVPHLPLGESAVPEGKSWLKESHPALRLLGHKGWTKRFKKKESDKIRQTICAQS